MLTVMLASWVVLAFILAWIAESRLRGSPAPISVLALAVGFAVAGMAARVMVFPEGLAPAIATISLVAAAQADARSGFLFDAVTLPSAVLVLILVAVLGRTGEAAAGALPVTAAFGATIFLSRGRVLGMGDLKAMFVMAAAFGPLDSAIALLVASLSGIGTTIVSGRFQRGAELRFGPHLAAGAIFTLLAGDPIARALARGS